MTSNFVESTDFAFWLIIGISVFFLVLITFLMIFFVIKYNAKRNPKAKNVTGNVPLEITWTVVPTILVLIVFWFGWVGYKQQTDIPEDAMKVKVTAQMWQWSFQYENGVRTDTMYVPVDKPVQVNLISLDVNHSFYVPAFRVKKDVIPNRTNKAWFIAQQPGRYDIACAEYCGLNHSNMYNKVVAVPQNEFDKWLSEKENQNKTESDTTKTVTDTETDTTKTSN